jgi:hypothetical protein
MKLPPLHPRARVAGFTLVEIFTVSAVFGLVMIAIVATQFFAARVYTLAATKLTATESGRKVMNYIREQIREGCDVEVGIFTPSTLTFSNVPEGSPQIGNAVVIYTNNPNLSYNTNSGIIYFMNPQASNICSVMVTNPFQGSLTVLPATLVTNVVVYITNYYAFDAEDCNDNILITSQNNRLIHVKFQYCQWEYPLAGVGNGAMYDYYQLQTRVAPRIINY